MFNTFLWIVVLPFSIAFPQGKVWYYLHIHKSGGTYVCRLAKQIYGDEGINGNDNCNVPRSLWYATDNRDYQRFSRKGGILSPTKDRWRMSCALKCTTTPYHVRADRHDWILYKRLWYFKKSGILMNMERMVGKGQLHHEEALWRFVRL